MSELDDHQLLAEFARKNSEAAFAALVQRHVNLVYSVALRSVGNVHAAEEITQAVFIILARKAKSFSRKTILSGWLYQTTQLTAANFLRGEIRRQKREQEAYMQSALNEPDANIWPQIAPLLDDALAKLGEKDRDAIVLRFFENKSLAEVGVTLGASEDAAKMRVNRALEKLRKFFTKRGVTLSGALIAGAVSANSVQAAPVGLAKTISAVAIAKGAAAGGSTLTLVKGTLKIMAWTKVKTAIVAGAVALLAAGTTTITVKEIQEHRTYPWQVEGFDSSVLDKQPPQVRILPSKCKFGAYGNTRNKNGQIKLMGTGASAVDVVEAAYIFYRPTRTVYSTELPPGKYDYIACLPKGNAEALQQEARKKFGLTAKREIRDTDILLVKIRNPNTPNLIPNNGGYESGTTFENPASGKWSGKNVSISDFLHYMEDLIKVPLIDQTALTSRFDFNLQWTQISGGNPDGLKQALLDQLGLELVPTNMPLEMLVVEKVK